MKYLVFDEMSKADFDRILANIQVHNEEREKGNLPPYIVPDHILHGDLPTFTQPMRSFKIYDTDDPKQLANIEALYAANDVPSKKRWIIPISALTEFVPAYEQYKTKVKT
jgi:hypothetical protein